MSTVRLRRLQADYDAIRRLVRLHPRIDIEGVLGNPPYRYRFVLKVRSLRERGERIETACEHRLEVTLPHGYPRDAPLFRMLTPVFHPNVAPHAVCIGDHWTAGEALDHQVQRVGEMLAYQTYNIKSPLNGRAAQWVSEHVARVPLDKDEFFVDLSTAPIPSGEMRAVRCANCDATETELRACEQEHVVCTDCATICEGCQRLMCLACGELECPRCNATTACTNCGGVAAVTCPSGHALCEDCRVHCTTCGELTCLVCGVDRCLRCAG